jgi:hypothetical protein
LKLHQTSHMKRHVLLETLPFICSSSELQCKLRERWDLIRRPFTVSTVILNWSSSWSNQHAYFVV